jgi:DNA-directed RNA polymerase
MAKSDLEKRQIKIELDSVRKGLGRVHDQMERAPLAQTKTGRGLIDLAHPILIGGIEKEQEELQNGAKRDYEIPLLAMASDRLAHLTLQAIFHEFGQSNSMISGVPMLGLAEKIGQWCEADAWYEEAGVRERRLYDAIFKRNKNPWNAKTRAEKKVKEYRDLKWGAKDVGIKLGAALLQHAVGTGFFEKKSQVKDSTLITFSKRGLKHLDKLLLEQEAFIQPYYLPTAIPPRPWKDGAGGGYKDLPLGFVKNLDGEVTGPEQDLGDLQIPCSAVNAIQETPWQLNRPLYEILHRVWRKKKPQAVVGPFKTVKVPAPLPEDKTPYELYRERGRERKAAEWHNKQVLVNKVLMRSRLAAALWLSKEEAIYFPHHIDWRGRAYAVPQVVNPHADDPGRALIEFREGKPLGERGAYWLSVHLANLYGGLSKRPFAERVRWVSDQREAILDLADRPFGGKEFWAKADKRWRFLAAALDYARYAREGEGINVHTPIAMDGTCNGLQHLSALGRDPEGGKWTNLIPSSQPQDLYQEVANRLIARVEEEAYQGWKPAEPWVGQINRNLVKQAAMTTPYGVTPNGIADQIYKVILGNRRFRDEEKASMYLALHLVKAIGEVVVKGVEIREWLRTVAGLFAQEEQSISWVTPTGFKVVQDYRHRDRRVSTVAGAFVKRERDPRVKHDVVKHQNSLVANLVHSLDASHMMLTVTEAHRQGLRYFGMAHDSYAVHACDVDLLNTVLRDQFIRVHEEFTLAGLFEQLKRQAPDIELPPPPASGALDLGEVRKSVYLFS